MALTLAQRIMKLFDGHEGAHGTHGVPVRDGLKWAIKSTARTVREPVTVEMWEAHLAGKKPLGVVPIRGDSNCSWGSIDVDEYDINLLDIIARVESAKLPLVPCRSKSGGLHLWLFMSEAVPAGQIQAVLKDLAAQLGLAGCEIFPKQTQMLTEQGDVGNWMVMPYYGDTYGGKIKEQVGLRKTGSELTLEEFVRAAEKASITEEALALLGQRRSKQANNSKKVLSGATVASNVTDFSDGPPCLQNMLVDGGIEKGGQSNTLLQMGIYYKRADPVNWEKRLERANHDFLSPPGSSEGLVNVIRSLRKKDYEYLCKTEPMCSHCNSTICRTRKFGVGDGGNVPIITSISKLDTEPVIWFVDVEGKRLQCSTEQLQNYMAFQKLCIDRLDKSYAPIKVGDWFAILNEALRNVVLLPVPPDIEQGGYFYELMEEFLTNRAKGNQKEDILSGRPWESDEDQRHYFRLRDFQKFLNREGIKELTRPQITAKISAMEGGNYDMSIKNKKTAVWYIPSNMISDPAELDAPPIKPPPI